jgi:hypothetical protein
MVTLPPNFDAAQFASDVIQIALPFVSIALLFLAYALIKKLSNRL